MSQLVAVEPVVTGKQISDRYRSARMRLSRPARGVPVAVVEAPSNEAPTPPPAALTLLSSPVKNYGDDQTHPVDSVGCDGPSSPVPSAVQPLPISRSKAIIRRIAEEFGMTVETIIGREQANDISRARHAAMYACTVETNLSLPQIGKAFGRDHTTVISGVRAHCRRNDLAYPRTMGPGDIERLRTKAREWHRRNRAK